MIRILSRLFVAALTLFLLPALASAQSSRTVKLAIQYSTDVPHLLLALDRNLWRDKGIEVTPIVFSSGREAFEALLGGQADVAVLTEYPATIGALRGQKFSIVADVARYKGLRAIAPKKAMTLSSLKALDGKKVGTTLGTNVEFVTSVILGEGGAKATAVNAAPADTVPALVRGDIDAAVMFPSLYAQAQRLLGDGYQEIRTTTYIAHALLVTSSALAETRPADAKAFVAGLLEAEKIVLADPAAGQQAVISALKGVMTAEVLKDLWADYDFRVMLGTDLVPLMAKEAAWIAERGMVKVGPEATSEKAMRAFINEGMLRELAPAAVAIGPKS